MKNTKNNKKVIWKVFFHGVRIKYAGMSKYLAFRLQFMLHLGGNHESCVFKSSLQVRIAGCGA